MMTSVASGPWGPCCSVAPVGTMTVSCVFRNASTSGLVISPRNTVGGFIALSPDFMVSNRSTSRLAPDLRSGGFRHDVDLQGWIRRRDICLFQAELAADDIAALRDRARLVERDFAVAALASEPAIARDDELLRID